MVRERRGKATSEAARELSVRSALITYTNNSEAELRTKANGICCCVPPHMRTATWFGFLLQHMVRPYQRAAYPGRVRGLAFVNGVSGRGSRETDTRRHYFRRSGDMYVDKVSKLACKLIRETEGKPVDRLVQIVDRIYVDEAQGLAGYDLDLIERLLDSKSEVVLAGDIGKRHLRRTNPPRTSNSGGSASSTSLQRGEPMAGPE